MRLSEKIPFLVRLRGTTQAELARSIGTYPSRLSEWISEKGSPSVKQALLLARALGVPVEYLIDDEMAEIPNRPVTDRERQVWEIVRKFGAERVYWWMVEGGLGEPDPGPPDDGVVGSSHEERSD